MSWDSGIPYLKCEQGHTNIHPLPEVGRVFCGTCQSWAQIDGTQSPSWQVPEIDWVAANFHEGPDEERVKWARRYRDLYGMAWVRSLNQTGQASR